MTLSIPIARTRREWTRSLAAASWLNSRFPLLGFLALVGTFAAVVG